MAIGPELFEGCVKHIYIHVYVYTREKEERELEGEGKEKVGGHRERERDLINKAAALHVPQNTMYPLNFTGER